MDSSFSEFHKRISKTRDLWDNRGMRRISCTLHQNVAPAVYSILGTNPIRIKNESRRESRRSMVSSISPVSASHAPYY